MKAQFYKTASATNSSEFDQRVDQLLREGWELYGNPYSNGQGALFQGMIKPVEEESSTVLAGSSGKRALNI